MELYENAHVIERLRDLKKGKGGYPLKPGHFVIASDFRILVALRLT